MTENAAAKTPGKRTLTGELQMKRAADGGDPAAAHEAAAQGTSGAATDFPHRAKIEEAFAQPIPATAHTDGKAAAASADLGAEAYAYGGAVAFNSTAPSLHTAAHEAAHVLQQAGGVKLKSGIGEVGDSYERHADEAADMVVQGKSAAHLFGDGGGSAGSGLQRKELQLRPNKKELTEGEKRVEAETESTQAVEAQIELLARRMDRTAEEFKSIGQAIWEIDSKQANDTTTTKGKDGFIGDAMNLMQKVKSFKDDDLRHIGNLIDATKVTREEIKEELADLNGANFRLVLGSQASRAGISQQPLSDINQAVQDVLAKVGLTQKELPRPKASTAKEDDLLASAIKENLEAALKEAVYARAQVATDDLKELSKPLRLTELHLQEAYVLLQQVAKPGKFKKEAKAAAKEAQKLVEEGKAKPEVAKLRQFGADSELVNTYNRVLHILDHPWKK